MSCEQLSVPPLPSPCKSQAKQMPLSAFEAEPDPLGRLQRQRINKTGESNPRGNL